MKSPLLELLPLPSYVRLLKQALPLPQGSQLVLQAPAGFSPPAWTRLSEALAARGVDCAVGGPASPGATLLRLELREQASASPEAYQLEVLGDGIRIQANSEAGLVHGLYTLRQWVTARLDHRGLLDGIEIEDAPTFQERGISLDISRNRIPKLATLLGLVEEFAALKYNRLQLYTEHAFAYREHAKVWQDAAPYTPDDIQAIAAHCLLHGIELVPNQQSFGHMHHWLKHSEYQHLAECPGGIQHPFSKDLEPYGLCPVDPACLEFLGGLYDELLPNFQSRVCNVGCDETIDLGLGRSAQACEEKGMGHVYMEFLVELHGLLAERDTGMQFWADIILNYPELVPELAERLPGATAMLWGYEAEHPFGVETKLVQASGLEFYVCPGTSAWQSLAGRFENMTANLASAALHGQAQGAKGYLVCDWGDRGHLQPLSSAFPGWAMGADLAWNQRAPSTRHSPAGLAQLLSQHLPMDPTGASGQAMVALAQVAATVQAPWHNASPLSLLITKADEPFPPKELEALGAPGLHAAEAQIEAALGTLQLHQISRSNASQVLAEITWGAQMMLFAAHLGLAHLGHRSTHLIQDMEKKARRQLAEELTPLIEEHARLWSSQHRQGGFQHSSQWLARIAADLNA